MRSSVDSNKQFTDSWCLVIQPISLHAQTYTQTQTCINIQASTRRKCLWKHSAIHCKAFTASLYCPLANTTVDKTFADNHKSFSLKIFPVYDNKLAHNDIKNEFLTVSLYLRDLANEATIMSKMERITSRN